MSKPETIKIDDIEYVRKDSAPEPDKEGYSIIRTQSAGVFAGYIKKREGQEATISNARRIWYWDGAASLSQLAVDGTSKPDTCKFPCEVSEITLTQVIEILPCSEKARKSIKSVKVWKQ